MKLLLSCSLVVLFFAAPTFATVYNFDDIASGTVIDNHYSGVTFSVKTADGIKDAIATAYTNTPTPSSFTPGNVFGMSNRYAAFGIAFDARYAIGIATFTTGQNDVGIYATAWHAKESLSPDPGNVPYMTAYDINGNFLGGMYYTKPVVDDTWQALTFHSDTPIYSVHFSSQSPGPGSDYYIYGIFDDLAVGADVSDPTSHWRMMKADVGPITTPEPSTVFLLGLGLAGIAARQFRKKKLI